MKITWSNKEDFIISIESPAADDGFVQNPVVILDPVVTIRGGGQKIVVDFDYTDFVSPLSLGSIPLGALIVNTVVEITTSFDAGAITIGTQAAQGILMTTGEVALTTGKYQRNNYLELDSAATFKAFFSGSPTMGSGKISTFYIE